MDDFENCIQGKNEPLARLNLQQTIENYFNEVKINDNKCPTCKHLRDCKQSSKMVSFPAGLIVRVNRQSIFRYQVTGKISISVELGNAIQVPGLGNTKARYEICSILEHRGVNVSCFV